MICLACGTTMNHHADKVEYAEGAGESAWGGAVMEVHTCPGCGNVGTQPAPGDPVNA
jgi:hypothetical protein